MRKNITEMNLYKKNKQTKYIAYQREIKVNHPSKMQTFTHNSLFKVVYLKVIYILTIIIFVCL